MARKRPYVSRGTAPKPADAESGAAAVRKYMIDLFDREDGRAADWPLIADTLLRAAFAALDEVPGNATAESLLRRVHEGAYNRLVKNDHDGAGPSGMADNTPRNGIDAAPAPVKNDIRP